MIAVRVLVVAALLAVPQPAAAPPAPPPPQSTGLAALTAFAGRWSGGGTTSETPYSHAGRATAQTTCGWSANHGFLVCDQLVHADAGDENDLSIYTYYDSTRTYAFYGLSRANPRVRTPQLEIAGNVWTYTGSFDTPGGKHVKIRTVNTFVTPDSVPYAVEYSENDGPWIAMGAGASHRVR